MFKRLRKCSSWDDGCKQAPAQSQLGGRSCPLRQVRAHRTCAVIVGVEAPLARWHRGCSTSGATWVVKPRQTTINFLASCKSHVLALSLVICRHWQTGCYAMSMTADRSTPRSGRGSDDGGAQGGGGGGDLLPAIHEDDDRAGSPNEQPQYLGAAAPPVVNGRERVPGGRG